jgi:uncharacterized repeat protein (TIGR01451 family)
MNPMVPVITNMNLDSNGNMVIGYTSANGWRWASRNYTPDPACSDLTEWHESNGHVVLATPGGAGWEVTGAEFIEHTNDDPSRHYWNATRAWWGSGSETRSTFTGGMDITNCSGQETLMLNMMDPINFESSGTRWGITSNGSLEAATNSTDTDLATITASTLEHYHGAGDEHWEKSTGLGDIEYLHEPAAPACSINTPTVTTECSNNGTPSDASDDKFTYKITATGSNVGATYSITGGDTYAGRSYGTEHTSTNSFPISGGNLALTLTDDTTASCKLENVTVTAPSTCSSSTPSADLEVAKTANVSSAKSGDTVIYTITVKNNGPDNATGVEVTDQLPTGVTYDSHNAGQGTYTSGTGIWAVGSLANDATATLTITVTIN